MLKHNPGNSFSFVAARFARRLRALRLIVAFVIIAATQTGHFYGQGIAPQIQGATINGVVVDDQSSPLAGATVTLSGQEIIPARITTQFDGKFQFIGLQPGRYRITVEAARFRKEAVNITIARADETIQQPPIKLQPSSLHVAVLDSANQPLAGVTVTLYNKERGAAGSIAERRTSDESGEAYFGKLPPGSYQLTAALRGYDEYRSDVFIVPDIRTELPLQLSVAPVIPINEKAVARYSLPNLPSKNVHSILQTSDGWVWIGTDKGVARFNGSDFSPLAAAGELSADDARSMAEDRSGTVWIATPRGVRRVSRSGEDQGVALAAQDARRIFADSRGNVWVATAQGVFEFNGKEFVSFNQSNGLASNDARDVVEDRNGRVWIATANGVNIFDGARLVPFEIPRDADKFNNQSSAARAQSEAITVSDAEALFVDKPGRVWIATSRGVFSYDGNRLSSPAGGAQQRYEKLPEGLSVRAISEDGAGRIWFALSTGGALLYDAARNEFQRIGFLERDSISAVFTCREGQVWFGTDNGAVASDFYSFVNFTTSRGLPDNDVRAVVELPAGVGGREQGGLWFFTATGVARIDASERFEAIKQYSSLSARAVAFDSEGTVWFATEQGVLRLSGQSLTQFTDNRLPSNNIRWVASVAGGSTVVLATTKGATIFRNGELTNLSTLAGYDVRHVFEDSDGRLWFSTERGVKSFDPSTSEVQTIDATQGLADNDTRSIIRFNDKLLIATRAGVQAYDTSAQRGPSFSTFDSEPTSAMFIDRDGFLWTGTDAGQVKKFVTVGGHVISTVYSGDVFALTASRINSFYEDSRKRIWIATDKGVVRHVPVTVAPSAQVSLDVDDKPDAPEETGLYSVPYGRHKVTFHLIAASASGQVRYLYRLNANDGNQAWQALPAQQEAEREISRLDLDEGAHTFELIALNRDLYGANAPAVAISLRVEPPLWKRWWFYALAVGALIVALGAVFVAHRLREREYVLPRHLRNYVPIEPNPYIVGNPIRSEKMFFGREDDFRYVRTKLEGVSQGVVIVFCGERRAGKSSILYQVLNGRLGSRFIPVFVDLQEMVIASDSEFFARISRLIADSVARANSRAVDAAVDKDLSSSDGLRVAATVGEASSTSGARTILSQASGPRIPVPEFGGRNPYPVFLDFLDEVLASIGDRTLLILMDEYELMEGKVDEGKLSPELFTFLAGLMDNRERLALMFTGSRRLEERDKKYWRELLRRSLFRKVGFLSEKDTVRLITEPVADRVVYGRGVVDAIYRLTAGQPFYTQVICQNTVDYLNEHEQNWVTAADLKQVIAEIVDNPLPQMIYTWDALSDDEKLVLSLLAETLADGDAFATAGALRASVKLNEYPVHLSENTIRLTLEEMFRRELLEKDATDGFRFKIDLFRLWIRRSHSIWQVVKEVRTL